MDPAKRDNHTPSCAICQRRKVKCSRTFPCSQCQKIGLECTFNPPAPRNRAKRLKRSAERDVPDGTNEAHDSATRYASPASLEQPRRVQQEISTQPSAPNTARLLSDGGGYRYVNNHLWNSLTTPTPVDSPGISGTPGSTSTAHPTPEGRSGESIYESAVQTAASTTQGSGFLFNHGRPDGNTSFINHTADLTLQPQPAHIIHLWQTYLARIDPIMKVFHAPTVQQLVLGQIARSTPAASEQALLSSIYLISTVSLTDDECRSSFREPRHVLITRLQKATEDALSAAGFVTTHSIIVLTAMLLYLASLRSLGDAQTVWTLSGLAIRIGGTIGLARDGSILNLPPFECEMRRRLWWALVYLDARTAELVGQDGDLLVQRYDARVPSNLNDSELSPSMSRLPDDRLGATEMVYVQLRAMIGKRMRAVPGATGPASTWQRMRATNVPMSEKAELLKGLEQQFHDEILRFCDPAVPIQYLTINSAKTLLTKLRLMANIPVVPESRHRDPDTELSDNLYELSTRLTNLQLDLWTEPNVQLFRWHWQGQFQWYGLACLIRQTRLRKAEPEAMKGWHVIRRVFQLIIPNLALGPKSPLLEGIQRLLVTATSAREVGQVHLPSTRVDGPDARTEPKATPPQHGFSVGGGSAPHSAMLPSLGSVDYGTVEQHDTPLDPEPDDPTFGFDFSSVDWDEFDRLTAELCRQ